MIVEIVAAGLFSLCLAFVVMSATGGLFAGLSLCSPCVRWVLPHLVCLTGLFFCIPEIGAWWHPVALFILFWWVIRDCWAGGVYQGKRYRDLWIRAVIKSTVLLASFALILVTMEEHHG